MRHGWLSLVLALGCASGDGEGQRSGGAQVGAGTMSGGGVGAGAAGSGGPGGSGGASGTGPLTPIDKAIMDGEECDLVTQQADNGKQPVDIIWAIDSSPSMTLTIDGMEAEMNNLVNTVTAADIDVHIILISAMWMKDVLFNNPIVGDHVLCIQPPVGSGDCNNDTNLPQYHHVSKECGGENGCSVGSHSALNAIMNHIGHYQADLRPDSLKYFGAVSDDTAGDTMDFAGQAAMFTAWVESQGFEDWKFFGIINPTLGQAYQMLADQTGGMTGEISIVPQDYTEMFNMLAVTVTNEVKLACEWEIPAVGGGAEGQFDQYKTNFKYTPGDGSTAPEVFHVSEPGDCGMEHGWYYDDNTAPHKVIVCPKTCATVQPDLMGKIDILFGCTTIERPD